MLKSPKHALRASPRILHTTIVQPDSVPQRPANPSGPPNVVESGRISMHATQQHVLLSPNLGDARAMDLRLTGLVRAI